MKLSTTLFAALQVGLAVRQDFFLYTPYMYGVYRNPWYKLVYAWASWSV